MTTMIPDRSIDQRMSALKNANVVRSRRARCKREIRDGSEDLGTLLSLPPSWLASAPVLEFLLARPGWGRVKCLRMLGVAGVSPAKTFGGLTDRQRRDLVGLLAAGGRR